MSDARTPGGATTGEVGQVRCVFCGTRIATNHARSMTSAKCRSRENDAYHVVLHDNLIHDYKKKGPDAIEPGKRHLFTAYHKQIEALD